VIPHAQYKCVDHACILLNRYFVLSQCTDYADFRPLTARTTAIKFILTVHLLQLSIWDDNGIGPFWQPAIGQTKVHGPCNDGTRAVYTPCI